MKNWPAVITETQQTSSLVTIDITGTPIAYYRGLAFSQMKRTDLAIKYFEKALRHNPNHLFIMMNLASSYASKGREEEALPYFIEIRNTYPDYVAVQQCIDKLVAIGGAKWQSQK